MFSLKPKPLVLTILALFVAIFITDFLIHGLLMAPDYEASAEVWRTQEAMQEMMPSMLVGYLFAAIAIAMLYARGFATGCHRRTFTFGIAIGAFAAANSFIFYAVLPIPCILGAKWIIFGLVQGVILGLIAHLTYGKGTVDPKIDAAP